MQSLIFINMNQVQIKKAKTTKNHKEQNKPTIVLMTRWHAIYRCKSRLAKEIGAIKAAKIQEKLTKHTITVAKKIQQEGLADVKVAIDGIGIKEFDSLDRF